MTPGTHRFTVAQTHSLSAGLARAAGLPHPLAQGMTIDCAPDPDADDLGTRWTVIAVDGQATAPLILTVPFPDRDVEDRLLQLATLHPVLDSLPDDDGVHAEFWWGKALDDTGRLVNVLLGTDLRRLGYRPLDEVTPGSLTERLQVAASLTGAASTLAGVPFTHAGLDGQTIWVDQAAGHAAITRLDGGALGRPGARTPVAVGPPTGHLAPEIYDADGVFPEAVGEHSDPWSLAVALHRILIGSHPYHMLPDLASNRVSDHLHRVGWPTPGEHANAVGSLPPDITDLMDRVFRDGWAQPAVRPTAVEWARAIGPWTGPPTFTSLTAQPQAVAAGMPVTLTWVTKHATSVRTSDGLVLAAAGTMTFMPRHTGPVTMIAVGPLGEIECTTPPVAVLRMPPPPRIRSTPRPDVVTVRAEVPTPRMSFTGAAIRAPGPPHVTVPAPKLFLRRRS